MAETVSTDFSQRLGNVFNRTLPKLGPSARDQLAALVTPESLAIIAGVLVAWVVSHAFGAGEAIDLILGIVGFLSIGFAVFTGLDELFGFAKDTYYASQDSDLERASSHLAKAIAILGIQAVLAVLFKGRPKGGRMNPGPEPAPTPGWRYKPKSVGDPALPAGVGETTFWGDMAFSTSGSANDVRLARLHEAVHQFMRPKFYVLRRVRVENVTGSYFRSSLYRYVDEALAETIAQAGVNVFTALFKGLAFPVENGYLYLVRAGGFSADMKGAGLLTEGAALLGTGSTAGFAYELWFRKGATKP